MVGSDDVVGPLRALGRGQLGGEVAAGRGRQRGRARLPVDGDDVDLLGALVDVVGRRRTERLATRVGPGRRLGERGLRAGSVGVAAVMRAWRSSTLVDWNTSTRGSSRCRRSRSVTRRSGSTFVMLAAKTSATAADVMSGASGSLAELVAAENGYENSPTGSQVVGPQVLDRPPEVATDPGLELRPGLQPVLVGQPAAVDHEGLPVPLGVDLDQVVAVLGVRLDVPTARAIQAVDLVPGEVVGPTRPHPTGDHEGDGVEVVLLEHGVGVAPEAPGAVVEGQQDGSGGQVGLPSTQSRSCPR